VCLPVRAPTNPAGLCGLVRRAMSEPALGDRAMAVAEGLYAQGPWDGLTRVVEHSRAVLG
jgi:hypothetical protein